jgi:hypothetical protein
MTMTLEETPRCECYFDSKTRSWTLRYFNCSDETGRKRARAYRIEQITKQLSGGSGLTNRERRELDREQNFLRRQFATEPSSPPSEKAAPKMKAEEKKLRWLARKAHRTTAAT